MSEPRFVCQRGTSRSLSTRTATLNTHPAGLWGPCCIQRSSGGRIWRNQSLGCETCVYLPLPHKRYLIQEDQVSRLSQASRMPFSRLVHVRRLLNSFHGQSCLSGFAFGMGAIAVLARDPLVSLVPLVQFCLME